MTFVLLSMVNLCCVYVYVVCTVSKSDTNSYEWNDHGQWLWTLNTFVQFHVYHMYPNKQLVGIGFISLRF